MRICVFGAGALGSAMGGMLASENEVTLVGRKHHIEAIRRGGLILSGDVRRKVRLTAYTEVSGLAPPELLLITTKAYDTQEAISGCRGWASDDTSVLTLQNGLGNLEALERWKGDSAFGGTTTLGSTLISSGKVRIAGLGNTYVGSASDPKRAREIAACFNSSGIPTGFRGDIRSEIWGKAVVSSCINPMTAILRVPNGRLLESQVVMGMLKGVSLECEKAARADGVSLPRVHMFPRVCEVAKDTSTNLSSMLQDVMRRRRTEIDQLNGEFSRLSEKHGLAAPLNRTLTSMVQSLQLGHSRNVNIGT